MGFVLAVWQWCGTYAGSCPGGQAGNAAPLPAGRLASSVFLHANRATTRRASLNAERTRGGRRPRRGRDKLQTATAAAMTHLASRAFHDALADWLAGTVGS